jgi:O-antigen/teichoic acid export membrane protein
VYAISNLYLAGFIGVIGVYLFPTLTRMLESGDRAGAEKELDAGLRMMMLVFTPLIVLLAIAAPLVVRLLYSRQFDAAAPVLRIQLAGDVLKVCAYSLGAVLLPLRLTRWWAAIGLCTVAVNTGLAWFLLPALHLSALGLAYSASWAVNLGATLVVILRVRGAWLSRRNALLVGASIVSVAGVVAVALFAPRAVSLSAGIAVGAAWASGALAALVRRR